MSAREKWWATAFSVMLLAPLGRAAAQEQPSRDPDCPEPDLPHVCDEPRSDACHAFCASQWTATCDDACEDAGDQQWCQDRCASGDDSGAWCSLPRTLSFQGPLLRFGVRGALGANIFDFPGGTLGLAGPVGVRFASNWSFIGWLHVPVSGLTRVAEDDWRYTFGVGLEAGFEAIAFDAFGEPNALTVAVTGGFWLPTQCLGQQCSIALPVASLHLGLVNMAGSAFRSTRNFAGLSVTLTGSVGYDPWTNEALGRVVAQVGWDAAIYVGDRRSPPSDSNRTDEATSEDDQPE